MLKIIQLTTNPKRKKKAKRAKKTRVVIVKKNPKRKRKVKRVKVTKVKKNPAHRKPVHTMLVGIIVRGKKAKRVYYTGRGFSRLKNDAKIFPGTAAKTEAKRIEPMLPHQIARLYMETV